jgi:hypothetical protein
VSFGVLRDGFLIANIIGDIEVIQNLIHLIIISKSGRPLYSQSMQRNEYGVNHNLILVKNEIVELSSIIEKIKQNVQLKVTETKNYKVMIDEGSHIILAMLVKTEIDNVREKMTNFIQDFELYFNELLIDWKRDTDIYSPAKILVSRHFEE